MRYLSWEMTPTAIARRLRVSIKTVSTHKRAVMRKMHFQRDAELYRWLRQGDSVREMAIATSSERWHGRSGPDGPERLTKTAAWCFRPEMPAAFH